MHERENSTGKEKHMRHNKDLNACLATLKRWQADTALDPGLKEGLQRVSRHLRKLSRRAKPDREEVLEVVRQISETLWKVFSLK